VDDSKALFARGGNTLISTRPDHNYNPFAKNYATFTGAIADNAQIVGLDHAVRGSEAMNNFLFASDQKPKEVQAFFFETFGRILGWLGWILKKLGLALKNQIGGPPEPAALPSDADHVARRNARHRGGEVSTQFPNPR
jgi:hypothetical protein